MKPIKATPVFQKTTIHEKKQVYSVVRLELKRSKMCVYKFIRIAWLCILNILHIDKFLVFFSNIHLSRKQ